MFLFLPTLEKVLGFQWTRLHPFHCSSLQSFVGKVSILPSSQKRCVARLPLQQPLCSEAYCLTVPSNVPMFPTVTARPRICSSRRHESAFSSSSFRCPCFLIVFRYMSNFLASVAYLRCRSSPLSPFPLPLPFVMCCTAAEDLVAAASLKHHLDRFNDLLLRLLTLGLGLVHCVQRNRWPNAQVLDALRVLLEEPRELGETRKLFERDLILGSLLMMMLHLSSSLGGAPPAATKSLVTLSYLSMFAMTSSAVLMMFGFLTCCPKTTLFRG